MPELAEVEYYRKQWNPGIGRPIQAVSLHPKARIFRGLRPNLLQSALPGTVFIESAAHGKQMAFRFSNNLWLGVHLGMSGRLRVQPLPFTRGKYDHLILYQKNQALVFSDFRQFGRVRFHSGPDRPAWWAHLPALITSSAFSLDTLTRFLQRHPRLPLKAALLRQDGFPGVGNWMADEILWRTGLHPLRLCKDVNLHARTLLWRTSRWVCRRALATVGQKDTHPPRGWLFHQRWHSGGHCPKDRQPLRRDSMGGRTTAWCPVCQPHQKGPPNKSAPE